MAVTINQGTQTPIATDLVGTTQYQIIKLDRGATGLSSLFTGTLDAVTSVANMVKGTVTRLEGGTLGVVSAISAGTVDTISQLPPNSWGTVVSTSGSTLGTIKPLVAGSQIFVTHLTISVGSATNVVIGNGGTSLPLMGTLFLNANGGVFASPLNPPLATTAGSSLVYMQSTGTSPMTITAGGFVR